MIVRRTFLSLGERMPARRTAAPESGGQVRGFDRTRVVAAIPPKHAKTFAASLRDAAGIFTISGWVVARVIENHAAKAETQRQAIDFIVARNCTLMLGFAKRSATSFNPINLDIAK
jgi:hypothetical protein